MTQGRLTDEELDEIDRTRFQTHMGEPPASVLVRRMLTELRERRAADLAESHMVQVARLADALPIDEEADRQATAALNRATAGQISRKLTMPALKPDEVEALTWAAGLLSYEARRRQGVAPHGWHNQAYAALAVLDRLIGAKS
jgi:hypothetical protein